MKFDIARAWKDENYRKTLSEEQLATLPANPAGELDDNELASVLGGSFGFGNNVGVGTSASSAFTDSRCHSYSLICDLSLFSVNLIQIQVIPIASPTRQVCAESH